MGDANSRVERGPGVGRMLRRGEELGESLGMATLGQNTLSMSWLEAWQRAGDYHHVILIPSRAWTIKFQSPSSTRGGGERAARSGGGEGDIRWQQSTEKLNLMGSALVLFLLSAPRERALSN